MMPLECPIESRLPPKNPRVHQWPPCRIHTKYWWDCPLLSVAIISGGSDGSVSIGYLGIGAKTGKIIEFDHLIYASADGVKADVPGDIDALPLDEQSLAAVLAPMTFAIIDNSASKVPELPSLPNLIHLDFITDISWPEYWPKDTAGILAMAGVIPGDRNPWDAVTAMAAALCVRCRVYPCQSLLAETIKGLGYLVLPQR